MTDIMPIMVSYYYHSADKERSRIQKWPVHAFPGNGNLSVTICLRSVFPPS